MILQKIYIFVIFCFIAASTAFYSIYNLGSSPSTDTFFINADRFMQKWVNEGNINYSKLKQDLSELESLLEQVEEVSLNNTSDVEKKAFYINAYNLLVISQIAKFYPLASPLDKNGFFDKFNHTVAGERITLDQLEKNHLMHNYQDPRIHFAVACGAISCPKLANYAFLPEQLEKQLDSRTSLALNKDDIISVVNERKSIAISKIFDWYAVDFGNSESSLRAFINKYRKDDLPYNYSLNYKEYDWSLNAITDLK